MFKMVETLYNISHNDVIEGCLKEAAEGVNEGGF